MIYELLRSTTQWLVTRVAAITVPATPEELNRPSALSSHGMFLPVFTLCQARYWRINSVPRLQSKFGPALLTN